jgi:uncharacterized membrane protein
MLLLTLNTIAIQALLTGPILLVMGWYLTYRPPRKINGTYGYRTSRSMKSQQAWNFAQRYSSERFMWGGVGLTVAGLISILFPNVGDVAGLVVGIALVLVTVFIPIILTEAQLKKRFG